MIMMPATSDLIMSHAGSQVVQQLSRIMPPAIELKLNLLGTQAACSGALLVFLLHTDLLHALWAPAQSLNPSCNVAQVSAPADRSRWSWC